MPREPEPWILGGSVAWFWMVGFVGPGLGDVPGPSVAVCAVARDDMQKERTATTGKRAPILILPRREKTPRPLAVAPGHSITSTAVRCSVGGFGFPNSDRPTSRR